MSFIATFLVASNVAICDTLEAMTELAKYMRAEGRTQQDIANRAGLSRSYVAEIASGAKMPGRSAMIKIQAATDGVVTVMSWFSPPSEDEE